jgi:hypothetical protein
MRRKSTKKIKRKKLYYCAVVKPRQSEKYLRKKKKAQKEKKRKKLYYCAVVKPRQKFEKKK